MSEERRNRFRQLGRRAGLSDRALDAVDHGVDRIRDHWFGKSEDERSSTEPLVGVDRIAEFAWATVQVLRGQARGSASVDEILELVAKELEIPPNAPERQRDPNKAESPYEYGIRHARNALIHQAKAIHHPQGSQYLRLTPRGREISQSTVKESVEKNEKELPSRQRSGEDLAEQKWQYKHKDWAWETLKAIQYLQTHNITEVGYLNGAISSQLAGQMALGPTALRDVWSRRNPEELEYKARCATMRAILQAMSLIERVEDPDSSATRWQILERGHEITEQEFREQLDSVNLDSLSREGNNRYRGNPELEQTMQKEIHLRTESMRNGLSARKTELENTQFADDASYYLCDRTLCSAVLRSIPVSNEQGEEGAHLSQKQIVESVIGNLSIPQSYLREKRPPWGPRKQRKQSLLEYRIEHVLRAMSTGQSGLIRDVGYERGVEETENNWRRTEYGNNQTLDLTSSTDHVWQNLEPYFETHSYAAWRTQPWHERLTEAMTKQWSDKDGNLNGKPFEHFVADLLDKEHDLSSGGIEVTGGFLDHAGVDIIAYQQQMTQRDVGGTHINRPEIRGLLFMQVKLYLGRVVEPGVPSKTFGIAARLRSQAKRNRETEVAGARLIVFGDLSRDAEWEFWVTKAAWGALEREEIQSRCQLELPQWEIWDGATVFSKIEEHKLGIQMDDSGVISPDSNYLRECLTRSEAHTNK